jgi:transmembrane sensor
MQNNAETPPGPLSSGDPCAEQAMAWVVRKDRGLDAEESHALLAWLEADPRHAEAFAQARHSWKGLDRLGTVKALAADADEIVRRARRRNRRRRIGLAAATLLSAAALVVFSLSRLETRHSVQAITEMRSGGYQVLESTARRVELGDGSVVELNGESRIEVNFTDNERRVQLVSGEAHFAVAKNPARPFFVSANGVTVRAVGTAFNVKLDTGSVEVLVTEGKILIHGSAESGPPISGTAGGQPLAAGQRAVVNTSNPQADVSVGTAGVLEIDQALAWQSTRLVFERTSLEEVVAAFNRFNDHQLVLGSPELRQQSLSGVFRADNLEGFLRLLDVASDVKTQTSRTQTVLLAKRR